jgi:hypothetical protein
VLLHAEAGVAEMYVPGEEEIEDGEMRVTVLGSGNPWVTRGQDISHLTPLVA